MDGASNSTLENEFGTHNEDECLIKILEKGEIQESDVSGHLTILPSLRACHSNPISLF